MASRGGQHLPGATTLVSITLFALAPAVQCWFGRGPSSGNAVPRAAMAAQVEISEPTREQIREAYGRLPLTFVPNAGQTDPRVRYTAQGADWELYLTGQEAVLAFADQTRQSDQREVVGHLPRRNGQTYWVEPAAQGVALAWRFLGANPHVRPEGREEGVGSVNYLLGRDPTRWHTGLPAYREVLYAGLWPRVDIAFRGGRGERPCVVVLQPGADIQSVRFGYRGAEEVTLGEAGSLRSRTVLGTLVHARPSAYQLIAGERRMVPCRYTVEALAKGDWRCGFAVGGYRHEAPLMIEAPLVAGAGLAGSRSEDTPGVAIDAAGSAYVIETAPSMDFPATAGPFAVPYRGSSQALVVKLDGAGMRYTTYLGGSGSETGNAIAVDRGGNACVAGWTRSVDFPTTTGAYDRAHNGDWDVFVAKLDARGAGLQYATYLGGRDQETVTALAVDGEGSAYVSGVTHSLDFPTTTAAFSGDGDPFLAKLDAAGGQLLYCAPADPAKSHPQRSAE
jgi:Beta-propeller repeat